MDESSSETRKRKPSSELGNLINEAPKGLKNLISKAVDIKCEPNLQEVPSRQPKERKKSEKVSGERAERSAETKESSKNKENDKKKSKEKKSRDRERERSHEKSRDKSHEESRDKEKSLRKIDPVAESAKRPEKRKLSASSVLDFSKRKIADSRSDDSAQLLRPSKEKSKIRNPALDLIARHRESGKSNIPYMYGTRTYPTQ